MPTPRKPACDIYAFARRNRAMQRKRVGCDRCKRDIATFKFESIDARLALWLCERCYQAMTGETP